jgi:hypothetical protein
MATKTRTIRFGEEIELNVPPKAGKGDGHNGGVGRRAQVVKPQRSAAPAADEPLPDDVKRVRGDTYLVLAGDRGIVVAEGKIILRRSGKSRQWARYLVGKVAGVLRTAIEVFLGYPTPDEIRAWLEKLPGGASSSAARAALLAWFEKLVDKVAPARLFAAVELLTGLGQRPALPAPVGA